MKLLYIGRDEASVRVQDISLTGLVLEQIEEFIYLGSVITSDGKFVQYIERRRAGATRAFGMLRRGLWSRREMKIFNAVVLPVLMYAATSWALTRMQERRLDVFEMDMSRNIVGVRWHEFVSNVDIRESLCQPPVSLKLRCARLKWFDHVERMGDERQVKKIVNAEMEGKIPVGRPRTRWKYVI